MMSKQAALKEAVRRWGNRAMVEDTGRESSPAIREKGKQDLEALKKKYPEKGRTKEQRREIQEASARSYRRRCKVGVHIDMCGLGCFFVNGEGDTFEEAFAKHDESQKKISKAISQ